MIKNSYNIHGPLSENDFRDAGYDLKFVHTTSQSQGSLKRHSPPGQLFLGKAGKCNQRRCL